MPSENNKRIAKNTIYLYFRMLLTMGVSLYTSRIVLATLGVEDYGIYNIVGGVIVMFGFLNSSMSGATSRFLTFELGRGNYEKLKKTFSAALTVHFIIAGIILILGMTIGLWFLENKLVIPAERISAARWVYHLSIVSSMISITQVPYNATIIAHERMNIYAYVEILNSLLKLGIVYILVIGSFDKLILYAILTLCVTIIITTIYKIYCTRNFPESHYKFIWEKEIIKPMMSYSGWNFFGNFSFTMKNQGVNMLLNLFFGAVLNAAYGLAAQVQSAIMGFSTNFLSAARPQIVKYYASDKKNEMKNLVISVSKYSFLLMLIVSFPVIIEGHFVLKLWLKKVPDYTAYFVQLNLLYALIWTQTVPFIYAIQATGKIKINTIINSTSYLLVIPLSYFCFKINITPVAPFIINIILLIIGYLVNLKVLSLLIKEFSFRTLLMECVLKNSMVFFIVFAITYPLILHQDESWTRLLLTIASSSTAIILCGYYILLKKNEQEYIKNTVTNTINKIRHK